MKLLFTIFLSLLYAAECLAQGGPTRAVLSLIPLYPDDGIFSGELSNLHVFLKRNGHTVVSYADANGQRIEMPIVFPNRIKVSLASSVEAIGPQGFVYRYRVEGPGDAPHGAVRLFLTVPRAEAERALEVHADLQSWVRDEMKFGPLGEGIGWLLRKPNVDAGAWSGELVLSIRAKPGIAFTYMSAPRALSGKWEDLPKMDEIESLERAGLGGIQLSAVAPKFYAGTHPYTIAAD